jgi:beta-RFAP synthase
MKPVVEVQSPCRLHFGMFRFGTQTGRQFGGVGVMMEPPVVDVRILPARIFSAQGSPNRVREFVSRIVDCWKLDSWPACEIVVRAPLSHRGLGVGTQLGLAAAAGLRRFLRLPDLPIEQLAASVGRGLRSAIGTYGFQHGGMIIDAGKERDETLGKLAARFPVPDNWRFVLLCPPGKLGLAGTSEAAAFAQLPPVPDKVTRELWAIANEQIVPAIEQKDCTRFGEAVYQFGRVAGGCFSAIQGGPYADVETQELVETIRRFGVRGVGQSSWGPTVFAVTAAADEAHRLVDWIRNQPFNRKYEITIARPNNSGAAIREGKLRM